MKDSLLQYDFEGQGSSAGSVGCCSLLESDNHLHFLDDLGPKFKTLAEICIPPTPIPKPSMTSKVTGAVKTTVDIVKPVVQPRIEKSVETKHTDIKTEKVTSSTNISKSSVSTGSAALASMTLPPSKVTNISHSSNISQCATLPHPPRAIVLQQQPVYYTTTPVLQPMHYIVQPQLQNTVLLADGNQRANISSMYVVNGPQNPSTGLVISGPQGPPSGIVVQSVQSSKSTTNSTSPVSPTLLLPVSPGVPQNPSPGLVISGPQGPPSGVVIQSIQSSKSSTSLTNPVNPTMLLPVGPGVPQNPSSGLVISGPQGPPSGVVMQSIQRSKSSASLTSPVNPTLLLPVSPGVSQGSVPVDGWKMVESNADGKYMLVKDTSSRGEAESVKPGSSQGTLPRGAVLVKQAAPPQGVLGPAAQGSVYAVLPGHTVATKANVVNVVNVNRNLGQTWAVQPGEKGIGPATVLGVGVGQPQMGMGHVVVVKPEVSQARNWPAAISPVETGQVSANQFQGNPPFDLRMGASGIPKASGIDSTKEDKTNNVTDVSHTTESADPQGNTEEEPETPQSEQQENPVLSECVSEEDISMVTKISSTEDALHESGISDLCNTGKDNEEITRIPQGEEAPSVSVPINIRNDQIHDSTEESVNRQDAEPLKEVQEEEKPVELSTGEGTVDRSFEVGSEPQSNEATEYQSGKDLSEDVPDIETNKVCTTFDSIQAEDDTEVMTIVTSDAYEVNTLDNELSATPPTETSLDNENEAEERSISDHETMPELHVNSEGDQIDECHAKTDITDAEAKTSLQNVSTISTNQKEELDDPNLELVSEEIQRAHDEDSNVPTTSTLEKQLRTVTPLDHEEEDDVIQQNVMEGPGVEKNQIVSDEYILSDGETEEIILQEGVSQQTLTTSDDQDEDIERQDALSTSSQMEDKLISDDNITNEETDEVAAEEMVSQVQQNVGFLNDQDEENEEDNALHTNSPLDNALVSEEEAIVEVVRIQEYVNITDNQDEEIEREVSSGRSSPLEDQLISEDSIQDGEKGEDAVEEELSPVQQTTSISDEDEQSENEHASQIVSQVEDKFISDDSASNYEEEVSSVEQKICISGDQDEESEREDGPESCPQSQNDFMCSENRYNEEKEDTVTSALQHKASVPDDESAKEDTSGTSSNAEEEIASYQNLEEDSKSLEIECLEMNQVAATSEVTETQEMSSEVTTDQVRQGIDSSQIGDEIQNIPERHDTVGQELVEAAELTGLNEALTSSEELISSKVATGQVSMFREDRGTSGSILASGESAEMMEKGKAEDTVDLEIREGLDNACGQVSPSYYSESEVMDQTLSSELETDPGSAETGAAGFTATNEVEEAGCPVQSESMQMTGQAVEEGLNMVGEGDPIDVVSDAPSVHGAEASGGQVSSVELLTVIGQVPRNKSRKSKKESNKSPQSSKSPSGKCKQQ